MNILLLHFFLYDVWFLRFMVSESVRIRALFVFVYFHLYIYMLESLFLFIHIKYLNIRYL